MATGPNAVPATPPRGDRGKAARATRRSPGRTNNECERPLPCGATELGRRQLGSRRGVRPLDHFPVYGDEAQGKRLALGGPPLERPNEGRRRRSRFDFCRRAQAVRPFGGGVTASTRRAFDVRKRRRKWAAPSTLSADQKNGSETCVGSLIPVSLVKQRSGARPNVVFLGEFEASSGALLGPPHDGHRGCRVFAKRASSGRVHPWGVGCGRVHDDTHD